MDCQKMKTSGIQDSNKFSGHLNAYHNDYQYCTIVHMLEFNMLCHYPVMLLLFSLKIISEDRSTLRNTLAVRPCQPRRVMRTTTCQTTLRNDHTKPVSPLMTPVMKISMLGIIPHLKGGRYRIVFYFLAK